MAKRRKKSSSSRRRTPMKGIGRRRTTKRGRRKGVRGIGAPGSSVERFLWTAGGFVATQYCIGKARGEWGEKAPIVALVGGGLLAYHGKDAMSESIGIGIALAGGIDFANARMPWICGIGDDDRRMMEKSIEGALNRAQTEIGDAREQTSIGANDNWNDGFN